ncbi:uncharacterized protein LOC125939659 [Dermacentor silvarum]|uniref:uncharacterized protein LOC125939659 n=1 Tax=Dermacentor silvarum TaxID=543639 RepID=UPI0021008CCA|nr:uncharacterized protein LOC125939659 [Dermacentor silvarum]
MIKSASLRAFVYLTIFLTRHCHVARSEIEILGSGVRPVNEPMGGPGPMPGDGDAPMGGGRELPGPGGESSSGDSEFGMSNSGGGGSRIIGLRRVGPLLNGGAPPGNMWNGNFGGNLPSSNLNGGGGGGDGGGGAPAVLGLGPGGSPLGSGNVDFEGGGDGSAFSGPGSGGSFGSGGGGFEGGNGGGLSSRFGAGFGGSSFGSGGGNFEGPQEGPGGNVNREGPPSGGFSGGGGGFGGSGFGGGGFGGGGFNGGGGAFTGTTSDRGYSGYGGATMPPRAPSSQGTREPQPETPKGSSEENSEETGW